MEKRSGIFYGVGVGPGDPELMTLKAVRLLERCPVIAAPQTAGGERLALEIARGAADLSGKEILPLHFTMARNPALRADSHREAVRQIAAHLAKGQDVAMVNLGDVALYSTFGYLAQGIRELGYEVVMVPGITSFSAVAARLGMSLAEQDTPLHIIPTCGMSTEEALSLPGNKVLMKSGSHLAEVKQALANRPQPAQAALVANCGLEGEVVCSDLQQAPESLSYYTTILVKE